jgi:hypothetical protein
VRIFNAGSQTLHIHQLFPHLPGNIGQSRPRRHGTNLLREGHTCLKPSQCEHKEKDPPIVVPR